MVVVFVPFRNPIVAGLNLIRSAIRSPNFLTGVSGWSINRDGSAEFNNATIRGDLVVGTAPTTISVLPAADLPAELIAQYPTAVSVIIQKSSATKYVYMVITPTTWAMGSYNGTTVLEQLTITGSNSEFTFNGTNLNIATELFVHAGSIVLGDGVTANSASMNIGATSTVNFDSGSRITYDFASDTIPYVPAWSGGATAIGNGLISGEYIKLGKLVIGHFDIVVGTTTNLGAGAAWSISLPLPTMLSTGANIGSVTAGTGATRYNGWLWQNGASSVAPSAEANTRWTSAVPFAFAVGSEIRGTFTYLTSA